jgi:hypothetical protein
MSAVGSNQLQLLLLLFLRSRPQKRRESGRGS